MSSKNLFILCLILAAMAIPVRSGATPIIEKSKWDAGMNSHVIKNVNIPQKSMVEAWGYIGQCLRYRTVLLISEETDLNKPFSLKAESISVGDLLQAFVSTYGNLAIHQDEKTGVVWIYPAHMLYSEILADTISIDKDQYELPMEVGVLDKISASSGDRVFTKRVGALIHFEFDYPINIAKGDYRIRDILNLACVYNPNVSFLIHDYTRLDRYEITPVNLLDSYKAADDPYTVTPPPGKLDFWRTEIGVLDHMPTTQDIVEKMSSEDPFIRWAAQRYLKNLQLPMYDEGALLKETTDPNKAAWLSIGLLNIVPPAPFAGDTSAIGRLTALAADDFLLKADEQLSILTAFNLARYTKDVHPLEIIAVRNYSDDTLSKTRGNVIHLARNSEPIQKFLRSKSGSTLRGKVMTDDSISTDSLTSLHYERR